MNSHAFVGAAWLIRQYGISLVMPLRVVSCIGGRRSTGVLDDVVTETYVASMRPSDTLRGHLTFHLKHEGMHLEFLARLFEVIEPRELVDWIHAEPAGQYARRAGFLWEWLAGRELPISDVTAGAYVDAADGSKMVVASPDQAVMHKRWRVRDNLPGTPAFCPVVANSAEVKTAMALDIPQLLKALSIEFGEDAVMRSSLWMTLRESKASFAIEGEVEQTERIARFADVLARRTGLGPVPLDHAALATLQSEILGARTTLHQTGIRQSPVFVGQAVQFQEVVHYIAPPAQDVSAMLLGLATFLARTQWQSAVMRSAVAAFGFVYIHPLADGNGRVHRLLINDILRRDGAVQAPMVVPISSWISKNPSTRQAYDRVLDVISQPLMHALVGHYEFTQVPTTWPDGVRSNFQFNGEHLARPVWRFPDLSAHVLYLADVLEHTIKGEMFEESRQLRCHSQARAAIKALIEMPDAQIDRVIRSVQANQGQLSNALFKEIPFLGDADLWTAIVQGVELAFGKH